MTNPAVIKKDKTPHVFVILFILVVFASLLTYIIPAGSFERVKDEALGQTIVVADSFKETEDSPVALWKLPEKIIEAITSESAVKLIFFIFFIGGAFEIIMQTGSITAFFENILYRFRNKRIWIIPVFVTLFSILGFTMGLSTASVIFVPIGILAARMLGFGLLTGTAMVALGVNAGFAAGVFNPFSVGIAQTIAEVPMYSGAWIRWMLLIFLLAATCIYIINYAKKYDLKEDSENYESKAREIFYPKAIEGGSPEKAPYLSGGLMQSKLSVRQNMVLIVFVLMFVIVTYGLSKWDWDTKSMSVLFLLSGITIGLIYGFNISTVCEHFVNGCRKMVKGALVIGLAATIRLVLSDGHIMDTIAYYLTGFALDLPDSAKLLGMFYGNAALDFLITSGSAHAAVAMPIMVPMTDFLGLSRQSAVFAFQLGDGLVNLCSPISTTLTGILAVSGISYGKWVRFFFPLVGIYMGIGTAFILLAGLVGY